MEDKVCILKLDNPQEIIVILLKSSNESLLKHKICQLDAIMIPSNASILSVIVSIRFE